MSIDWEIQRRRNIYSADNPSPGDRWSEFFGVTCDVLAVGPDYVTIRKQEGVETVTRKQFAKWIRYNTIPDNTWADLLPMSLSAQSP